MRRTIEKLNKSRVEKERELFTRLEEIKSKSLKIESEFDSSSVQKYLSRLESLIKSQSSADHSSPKKSFLTKTKDLHSNTAQSDINLQTQLAFKELYHVIHANMINTNDLLSHLSEVLKKGLELTDIKDKEWDALSSNHTGVIFKSMEWRIDRLTSAYEDVSFLMKKFTLLKENLVNLIALIEAKKIPSSIQIKELIDPLEDGIYSSFENRFRGSANDVKFQQQDYLQFFEKGCKVLDLGCGRGEFMELLNEKGLSSFGVDINEQMIEICKEKGLDCSKADILETLGLQDDNSLGGIFSSQVIEHLQPNYLKRMIELAFIKLVPSTSIVLETVNPSSVFALVEIYFLDLSHQKPIHPQALKFLLESVGFEEVEIKYSAPLKNEKLDGLEPIDEAAIIFNKNVDKLNKLLYAPSNYAIIATKPLDYS